MNAIVEAARMGKMIERKYDKDYNWEDYFFTCNTEEDYKKMIDVMKKDIEYYESLLK